MHAQIVRRHALAYWVQKDDDFFLRSLRRQPTHLPGMLTRREVVEYYAQQTGRRTDNWAFYRCTACSVWP